MLNDKSLFLFKRLEDPACVQAKGARLLVLGGINGFLRIHAAGHKSSALLLTIRALINRRGDKRLTKGGAKSAVRNATPPAGARFS
jgi:hypothetical protein